MKNIVFQGDSITDANRENTIHKFGCGYASLVTAQLCSKFPGEYKCVNRGVSGDRVVDVYARIKRDLWNLEPDFVSFFVGVNDIWHEYNGKNGVEPERFEKVYDMIIQDTLEKFPKVKIFLIAPFISKGWILDDLGENFQKDVFERAKLVQKIAKKHNLPCITLQDKFDKAHESFGDAGYWTVDGVHPTPAGHQIIADAWLEVFNELK